MTKETIQLCLLGFAVIYLVKAMITGNGHDYVSSNVFVASTLVISAQ